MVTTLGDNAPALLTVKKWAAESKRGGENLENNQDQDDLPQPSLEKKIDRIYQMVMDHRRLTVNHIANVMSIFREQLFPQETWHVECLFSMGAPALDN